MTSISPPTGETEVSPAPSPLSQTVTVGTDHDKTQPQGQIHAVSNHSPITVTTEQHQQLFQISEPSTLPTFSVYSATATQGINNQTSTSTSSSATGSPTITAAKSALAPASAVFATTSASTTTAPHNFHFVMGEGVKEPLPTDVICGRGKMTASHPANRRFRELVDSHKAAYQNSKRRDEKTRITCELVDKLRAEGRFVLFDPNTKLWYEVSEEYAREKVSHSLRSRSTSSEHRNATNANNSFRILNSAAQPHEQETVVKIAPRTELIHGNNGYHPLPAAVGSSASMAASKAGSPSTLTTKTTTTTTTINIINNNNNNNGTKSKSKPIPGSGKAKVTNNGALHHHRKLPAKTVVHKPSRLSKHSKLKPGLDDVVRRLITDQQALLRAMVQKETERFTSAAAMGPPPRQLPLSFKAEASAVSTLTDSLPKMGTPAVPLAPVQLAVPVAAASTGDPFEARPPPGSVSSTESTDIGVVENQFATSGDPTSNEPSSTAATIATVSAI